MHKTDLEYMILKRRMPINVRNLEIKWVKQLEMYIFDTLLKSNIYQSYTLKCNEMLDLLENILLEFYSTS